jgi:hypothetical protein
VITRNTAPVQHEVSFAGDTARLLSFAIVIGLALVFESLLPAATARYLGGGQPASSDRVSS